MMRCASWGGHSGLGGAGYGPDMQRPQPGTAWHRVWGRADDLVLSTQCEGLSAKDSVLVTVPVAVGRRLGLWLVTDQNFGGQQHSGDRCGVLHCRPRHLDWVDDTLRHHVAELT